ncbi:uncharacterized protein FFE2_16023 [Fusarium fujikuroi]|nr:uncharacterized protein FFE2_16023 [Fusarium fujikuroi]
MRYRQARQTNYLIN